MHELVPSQYFYHSDHLGSSSFITDVSGYARQHLQYLPFGEVMVDERLENQYNARYKFSAKELDDETQYSYFGARYYDSDVSIWLSVDPMADKYPSMSPFMYCAGNPVMLVDPDGNSIIIYYLSSDGKIEPYIYGSGEKYPNSFVRKTVKTLDKIQKRGRDKFGIISFFANSSIYHIGVHQSSGADVGASAVDATGYNTEYPVFWSPNRGAISKKGSLDKYKLSPALTLLHEVAEAYYGLKDPDGRLKPLREILHSRELGAEEKPTTDFLGKLNNYLDQEKLDCGDYGTYSDKWIIENVEPAFNKKSRGTNRKTHQGDVLITNGGPFSTRGERKKQ